jgi:hypothetical protein
MKKVIDIVTILFALWTVITGIADSDIHVLVSVTFIVLICIHAFMYRNLLITYFKGLRWKWVLVALALTVMVITATLD